MLTRIKLTDHFTHFSFVVLKVESLVTHLSTLCEERYAPWHA